MCWLLYPNCPAKVYSNYPARHQKNIVKYYKNYPTECDTSRRDGRKYMQETSTGYVKPIGYTLISQMLKTTKHNLINHRNNESSLPTLVNTNGSTDTWIHRYYSKYSALYFTVARSTEGRSPAGFAVSVHLRPLLARVHVRSLWLNCACFCYNATKWVYFSTPHIHIRFLRANRVL